MEGWHNHYLCRDDFCPWVLSEDEIKQEEPHGKREDEDQKPSHPVV